MDNEPQSKHYAVLEYKKQNSRDCKVCFAVIILFACISLFFINYGTFPYTQILLVIIYIFMYLYFNISEKLLLQLVCKHNFKIDLKKQTISITDYPIIEFHEHTGKYSKDRKTFNILIAQIASVHKYNEHFIFTILSINDYFEFVMPITIETREFVEIYNKRLKDYIGKNIQITLKNKPIYKYSGDEVIFSMQDNFSNKEQITAEVSMYTGKIINLQDYFDGYFNRKIFLAQIDSDFTIDNINFGNTLLLINEVEHDLKDSRTAFVRANKEKIKGYLEADLNLILSPQ